MEEVKQNFLDSPALNSLQCIRNHRVYLFPLYEGQYSTVRTMEGIKTVAEGLYPEMASEENRWKMRCSSFINRSVFTMDREMKRSVLVHRYWPFVIAWFINYCNIEICIFIISKIL